MRSPTTLPQDGDQAPLCGLGRDHVRRKTEFALKAGLAGVMFWELGQDAAGDGSLLKVIRSTVASWSPAE
jgi:hypothetical protein